MLERELEEFGVPGSALRRQRRNHVLVWVLAVAIHVGVFAAFDDRQSHGRPFPPRARVGLSACGDTLTTLERETSAARARATLLAKARADLAAGKLELGGFLLDANAVDADEEGVAFDHDAATRAYRDLVDRLRTALAAGAPIEGAVQQVFGEFAYSGTPGGRMGDALLRRRGSCEPLSQLVAAALYDAGIRDRARLRYYGAPSAGITHLAPVLAPEPNTKEPGATIDLMTGLPASAGGSEFAAVELVDVWERAHQASVADNRVTNAPPVGLVDDASLPKTATLAGGYPANRDRFSGTLPLFASSAFTRPAKGEETSPTEERQGRGQRRQDPRPCAPYVALAWLDPPSATAIVAGGLEQVELVREPQPTELERLVTLIQGVEGARIQETDDPAGAVVEEACLVALYQRAGLLFSLAGKSDVARRATQSAARERNRAAHALRELSKLPDKARQRQLERIADRSLGRGWLLLFVEEGRELVLEMARTAKTSLGRTPQLTALLVSPATRADAIALTDQFGLDTLIDVMHELVHAHDNARPWSARYTLDLSTTPELSSSRFARVYEVFAPLAWRLWEAQMAPSETIAALVRESAAIGLSAAEEQAIASYYLKQLVLLYHRRTGGPELIQTASRLLETAGFGGLAAIAQDGFLLPREKALFEALSRGQSPPADDVLP
ncbi:MAG: hypothetical protein U0271_21850 [Polyangiaceae bacterium]